MECFVLLCHIGEGPVPAALVVFASITIIAIIAIIGYLTYVCRFHSTIKLYLLFVE